MTDEARADKKPPIYRNPYAIAFVIGILTLTLLRPRMRNVPDAPPLSGAISVAGLMDEDGTPFSADDWAAVTLVGFTESNGVDCGGMALLSKLWHMYRQEDFEAEVLLISLSHADAKQLRRHEAQWGGPRQGWHVLGGVDASGASQREAALLTHLEGWLPIRETMRRPRRPASLEPWPECEGHELLEWVALVDSDGQSRGFYNVSDWEVESELFHRTHRLLPQASE
ncbi:MAG: hypothetical protein ACJAYU_000760 [Bradymonadia bacterium]